MFIIDSDWKLHQNLPEFKICFDQPKVQNLNICHNQLFKNKNINNHKNLQLQLPSAPQFPNWSVSRHHSETDETEYINVIQGV